MKNKCEILLLILLVISLSHSFWVKWSYSEVRSLDWMTFGSSGAIIDLGNDVNTVGSEPDSCMEIVIGSDEYYNYFPEIMDSARGIWRCLDAYGNLEWAINTKADESRCSPAIADFYGDSLLDIIGGTTSGWNLEAFDRLGNFLWYFPNPLQQDGTYMWHSSPAVADLIPSIAGLEIVIGNNSCYSMFCFQADPTDSVDEGITYTVPILGCFLGYTSPGGTDGTDWDVLWVYEADGPVISTPAVGDMDGDGDLDVLFGDGYKGTYSSEHNPGGNLYCLDGPTGTLRWKITTTTYPEVVDASPALHDFDDDGDLEVIIGTGDGNIYFIDGDENSTGVIEPFEMTTFNMNSEIHSSAVIADVDGDGSYEIIVGANSGAIACLSYSPPTTVSLKWIDTLDGAIVSSPAVAGNMHDPAPWPFFCQNNMRSNFYPPTDTALFVFVSTLNGKIYKISGINGELTDSIRLGFHIHTSPVIADIDYDCEYELIITVMIPSGDSIYCLGTDIYRKDCLDCREVIVNTICPPETETIISSCEEQTVSFAITDTTRWDTLDVEQMSAGITIHHLDGSEKTIFLNSDSIGFNTRIATIDSLILEIKHPWEHRDSITIWTDMIVSAKECTTYPANQVSFLVDLEPPILIPSPSMPPIGGNGPAIMEIEFELVDTPAGVAYDSTRMSVLAFHIDTTMDYYLVEDSTHMSCIFHPNDSVIISIHTCDSIIDYGCSCPPNCTTYSYWFRITGTGPEAEIIIPQPYTISACIDQQIWIHLTDPEGIDSTSIVLVVNRDTFTTFDEEVYYKLDTLYFSPPVGYWRNHDTVIVSLIAANDIYGSELQRPLSWIFYTDFVPPIAFLIAPPESIVVFDREQEIEINLIDQLSGVNLDSLKLYVLGRNFYWDDLDISGSHITLHSREKGLLFSPGDSINVDLFCCDSPDTCGPNCILYNWIFFIAPPSECQRMPNPFSPNYDNINDYVYFTFPNIFFEEATIYIYNLHNIKINEIHVPSGEIAKECARWSGLDTDGNPMPQGLYIYLIETSGEIVCEGTVTIAR